MRKITFFLLILQFAQFYGQNDNQLKLRDQRTNEEVIFQKSQISDEGIVISESMVDNIMYKKINGSFYKRIIPNKIVDVSWFGNNSEAIQKAIDFACVDVGPWKRAKYSVYLPEMVYDIDKKIVVKNVEGLHLYGGGIGTLLQIKKNTHLDAILELNGTAYGVFENFYFGSDSGASCESFINMYWGDKVSAIQKSPHPRRSSTQNSFSNIRNIAGKFVHAVRIDGHNQNDVSMWYNCSFNGEWNPNEKFYQSAFYLGDGKSGNNLIHNFQNSYIVGVKSAFIFAGVGGSITGGGASNIDTYIVRNNPNETLLVSSVRLEGTKRIYRNDGHLNGIHEVPDNVTLQNLWYSGSGSNEKHFQPAEDGVLIFHGGGNMNIIGSTIMYLPSNYKMKIKLSGAMNDNFHNSLNIIGSNFQGKFDDLFIVDIWAHASVNVIGSNETSGGNGTAMGKHIHQWMKDFNYQSETNINQKK